METLSICANIVPINKDENLKVTCLNKGIELNIFPIDETNTNNLLVRPIENKTINIKLDSVEETTDLFIKELNTDPVFLTIDIKK